VAQAECTFFTGWVDNKDGTVTDPRNGLIWKRCAEGFEFRGGVCEGLLETQADSKLAVLIAERSRFLDKSDWRLPTKVEFEAVLGNPKECWNIKEGEFAASKAIAHFGGINHIGNTYWVSGIYWSLSGWRGVNSVTLRNGATYRAQRSDSYGVRLVRSSQALGGEAALEFVNEKADKIAALERQRAAEEARKKELAQQRAVEEQKRRIAEEAETRQRQIEQAQVRAKLPAFRKSLREGDDTNCGPIIEIKGKLIKVAFAVANYGNEHWVKREQILSPDYACRFVNGQYQSQ